MNEDPCGMRIRLRNTKKATHSGVRGILCVGTGRLVSERGRVGFRPVIQMLANTPPPPRHTPLAARTRVAEPNQ